MGIRKIFTGVVEHVGWWPKHRYEDRDGVKVCTGWDDMIQLVVKVTEGRDRDREIRVELTDQGAAELIDQLSVARWKLTSTRQEG